MSERFKLSLSGLWLLTSGLSLIFPIFIPSSADSASFAANAIGSATATMFILSFPSSLFGVPAMFLAGTALNLDPNSMGGMYINLLLLFALGLVQWFWIVPRLFRNEPNVLQILDLPVQKHALHPVVPQDSVNFENFDDDARSPLERVFSEKEKES
jgi:hypothetical protein